MWKANNLLEFVRIPVNFLQALRAESVAPAPLGLNNLVKGLQLAPAPRLCRESPLTAADSRATLGARGGGKQTTDRPPSAFPPPLTQALAREYEPSCSAKSSWVRGPMAIL